MCCLESFFLLIVSLHSLISLFQDLFNIRNIGVDLVKFLNLLLGMGCNACNISLDLNDILSHLVHMVVNLLHQLVSILNHCIGLIM